MRISRSKGYSTGHKSENNDVTSFLFALGSKLVSIKSIFTSNLSFINHLSAHLGYKNLKETRNFAVLVSCPAEN